MDDKNIPKNNDQSPRQKSKSIKKCKHDEVPEASPSKSRNESHKENLTLSDELSSSIPEKRQKLTQQKKIKPKRLTTQQIIRIESEFKKNSNPSIQAIEELAEELELDESDILDWFKKERHVINNQLKDSNGQIIQMKDGETQTEEHFLESESEDENLNIIPPAVPKLLDESESKPPLPSAEISDDSNPIREEPMDIWIGAPWPPVKNKPSTKPTLEEIEASL